MPHDPETESLPMNCLFTDTITVPVEDPLVLSSMHFPLDRELLDMPTVIPEQEVEEEYFFWDDVAG